MNARNDATFPLNDAVTSTPTITAGVHCQHEWQPAQSTSKTTWECRKCHAYQYRPVGSLLGDTKP